MQCTINVSTKTLSIPAVLPRCCAVTVACVTVTLLVVLAAAAAT